MRLESRLLGRLVSLVAVLGCVVLGRAPVHAQATDTDGSIVTEQWLALGPFATSTGCDGNPGITGLYGNHIGPVHHIGCEAPEIGDVVEGYDPLLEAVVTTGLHPQAPQDPDGNPVWYAWDDGSPFDGDQNFELSPAGAIDEHMMYLATYIEYIGDDPIVVGVCFGSDDDGQVWIDDEIVNNQAACRGRSPCADSFFVTITPGVHVIKMAAWDQGVDWGAVLSLNIDGIPIMDGDAEWVFLGRDEDFGGDIDLDACSPEDYEVFDLPGGIGCVRTNDGGVDLSWTNHAAADPTGMIAVLVDGVEVAALPGDTEQYSVASEVALDAGEFCVRSDGGLRLCTSCNLVAEDGNITTSAWIAIGPFHGPGCAGSSGNFLAPSFLGCEYPAVGDELRSGYDPALAAGGGVHPYAQTTPDGEPIWYAFDDGLDDGDQNFNLGSPDPDNVVQFAVTYVEYTGNESPVNLRMCVSSDDSVEVWINKERIHFNSICRPVDTCQDYFGVELPGAGVYRIAVGVWDGHSGWGFRLGLQDEFGSPIFNDGPDWIYHGRSRPDDIDDLVPGGTDCDECLEAVSNPDCEFIDGLSVTWENPEDCECITEIELKIDGRVVAVAAPDAEDAFISANLLPDGLFYVTITNCSGLSASCALNNTDERGLFLTQSWLAIGPFGASGCNGSLENYLAPSSIGCEYPVEGDELLRGYDELLAASNGLHELAPTTMDGEPVWYRFDDGTNNSDQDFNLGTPEPDNVVQYAITYVEYTGPESPVNINMCVGSDDSVDVWFNDQRVHFNNICRNRGNLACQDSVLVSLPGAGVYRIAVGVWDGHSGWGFFLGLQDEFFFPIVDDGSNSEWIFHGRTRPEGFDGPCPDCRAPSELTCATTAEGLSLNWQNPKNCDAEIRILLHGEDYMTVPAGTTSFEIPAADIPFAGSVSLDNGSLDQATCSFIEETDHHTTRGFVKSWLMLGPFEQPNGPNPSCPAAALDYLTDGTVGEADIQPAEDDEILTDFGGAAASTGLAETPGQPFLNPGGVPTWAAHFNSDDTINYNDEWYFGDPNGVMVYSAFYVDVLSEVTVDIGVGSDDSIQVLVDGIEVGCVSVGREFADANIVQNVFPDITLSAGRHLIMTKVFDGCCAHGHRLRFQRNGVPIVPGEISAGTKRDTLVRGDADGNGVMELTDAVAIFQYLFFGRMVTCLDALDADDSGAIDLTDGIYDLTFLFRGGDAPPWPYPDCGVDLSADNLDCAAFDACL